MPKRLRLLVPLCLLLLGAAAGCTSTSYDVWGGEYAQMRRTSLRAQKIAQAHGFVPAGPAQPSSAESVGPPVALRETFFYRADASQARLTITTRRNLTVGIDWHFHLDTPDTRAVSRSLVQELKRQGFTIDGKT